MERSVTRAHAAPQQRGPHPLGAFWALALRVTGGDRERLARVLRGVRAYQEHPFARRAPAYPDAARAGAARLADCGGSGPPVVLVPSLINGPEVLDLGPGMSLVATLRAQGLRPLLLEWGPGADAAALPIDGLIEERVLPLLAALGEPPFVVGYCLGGTIALGAAAIRPPRKLALIAAPWAFGRYPAARRAEMAALWAGLRAGAAAAGSVPVELLQPGFWDLDPERTVAKFERFDGAAPDAERYVAVEDWANGGPAIGAAAARQLFEAFFADDAPGRGAWRPGGAAADPARLGCPVLNVLAGRDRIVPAEAAPPGGERLRLEAGHVGMVVGSRGAELLHRPLARWLLA